MLPTLTTRCSHAASCGGCSFQDRPYDAQLQQKQAWIEELFAGMGGEIHPIIPCADPWRYRNKMEFSFSQDKKGNRYLGLMMRGGRGRVLDLKECHIASSWFSEALAATRSWWVKSGLAAYHPYRNTGSLRNLTLREGKRTGSKMAILTISGHPDFAVSRKAMQEWAAMLPDTSCFVSIQQAMKGEPTQFFEIHLTGPEALLEELHFPWGPLKLQISPRSFFQPNTLQAEILYARALEMANPSQEAHILDLYCGTATIGMAFAPRVKEVTAIELNPYAIIDAQENLLRNNITNLRLIKGDAHEKLAEVLKEGRQFDLIIVDPPRTGLGPKALQTLLLARAKQILYIACNPAIQAEEAKTLIANGYQLQALQPLDQFPHTPHLENIALFTRVEC